MSLANLSSAYQVTPLPPSRVDAAWPLVRTCGGFATPSEWRDFATTRMADGRLLVATSDDGLVHGVAAWACRDEPCGPALRADLFVAFELLARAPARAALARALERIADGLDCRSIEIPLDRGARPHPAVVSQWSELGYAADQRVARKALFPDFVGSHG